MRQSRLRKFKKRKVGMLIIVQLFLIYYLGVYGLFEFTTPTNAAFNDVESLTLSLKTADEFGTSDDDDDGEWDKSSLKFKGQIAHCQDGTISAIVQNGEGSRDMKGSVTYEVFWAAKGNPKPDKGGTHVESGQVPALNSGETYEIFYKPTKPGNYMFRASQRPGHPGKGELWSDSIQVEQKCISNHKQQSNPIENLELEPITEEQDEINKKQKDETKRSQEQDNKGKTTEEGSQSSNEIQQKNKVKGADNSDENNNEMD